MEQRSSTVATLRATKGLAALGKGPELRAGAGIGGGGGGPTLGVVPGRRLGRQATLAKGYRLLQPPAALPLFDMSVAVIDSLNLMRASIEEEVVMQSALAVPAHQALACRIEAYGTPFGAPALQSIVEGQLSSEADKQFAACLAAPPEADAIGGLDPAFSLQRMASISALQRGSAGPSLATEQQAPGGAPGGPAAPRAAARGGELLRMPSIQASKKDKKVERLGTSNSSNPIGDSRAAGAGDEDTAAAARWDVSTVAGRAAIAAAAAERRRRGTLGAQLFDMSGDVVAAMVGVGYLLMRAAGFSKSTPRAVERLSSELRRMSSVSLGSHPSFAASNSAAAFATA